MNLLLAAFTFVAGLVSAFQSGSNATLGRAIGPAFAGFGSLAGSALLLLVFGLATGRLNVASLAGAGSAPWWAWAGGFCGGLLILAQLLAAEQLGSALFMGLVVTASIATSIVLDHYGFVGFEVHPATWPRIVGALLMFAGLGLIARF